MATSVDDVDGGHLTRVHFCTIGHKLLIMVERKRIILLKDDPPKGLFNTMWSALKA